MPHRSLPRLRALATLLVLLTLPGSSPAQTNDEINAGLQLDFAPPGARSLGLGHAFIGLADDATAAWANPAGLLSLTRPEVSAELRFRRDIQEFPDTGNASGSPTGFGIDTAPGLTFSESESSSTGLGYLAYVAVPGERWRLAAFRHELARFDTRIDSQGPFIREGSLRSRLAAVEAELSMDIVQYGVSGAWALGKRLWLGIGIGLYDFRYDAVTRRHLTIDTSSPSSQAIFEAVPTVAANERDRHVQEGDDQALGGVLGLLWRSADRRVSVGLVYRHGPTFELDYRFEWRTRAALLAAGDRDGDGVIESEPNLDFIDPGLEAALSGTTNFELPHVLGLGLAWRPTPTLTLSIQVDRVGYSRLEPDANILLNGLDRPASCGDFDADGRPQPRQPCVVAPRRFERFRVPDTTEPHLGLEWVRTEGLPAWLGARGVRALALRFGAWHEPDHRLVFEDPGGPPDDRLAARFQPGDDTFHGTFGLGFVGRSLQVDLAVDLSDRGEMASLSAVYRF